MLRIGRLTALACFILASSAAAQSAPAQSNTSGFFANVHLNGSAMRLDQTNAVTESGGGIGAMVGYGFTPNFAAFLALDGASVQSKDALFTGSYGLGYFDLGARYHFANTARSWVPYLEAALSGQAVAAEVTVGSASGDVEMNGAGFSFGGGVQFFFSLPLALDVGLKWTAGNFSEATVDGIGFAMDDVGNTAARFNVGLSWYPMK